MSESGLRLRFSGKDDLMETVRNSGTTNWFDKPTLRWWRARVGETLHGPGGRVFVTSEQRDSYTERRYTVRVLNVALGNDGSEGYSVQTIGTFGAYARGQAAHRAASRVGRAHMEDMPAYVDDETAEEYAREADIPVVGGFSRL